MAWEEVMLHLMHLSQQCLHPARAEDMKSGCLLLKGFSEGHSAISLLSACSICHGDACHATGTSAAQPGLFDTGQEASGETEAGLAGLLNMWCLSEVFVIGQ